jgi:hypothetical protein
VRLERGDSSVQVTCLSNVTRRVPLIGLLTPIIDERVDDHSSG